MNELIVDALNLDLMSFTELLVYKNYDNIIMYNSTNIYIYNENNYLWQLQKGNDDILLMIKNVIDDFVLCGDDEIIYEKI